jgi:hypothetical protein
VHHLDPAVQWLERDYGHMYLAVDNDEMENGIVSTVLMDDRTRDEWYEAQYDYGDDDGESGNSTETPQPMFTLKTDYYEDPALDDSFQAARWRWNYSHGPVLPNEQSYTAAEADENRTESYVFYLLNYMLGNGITPTPELEQRVAEWRAAQDAFMERQRAEWKRMADERRASGETRGILGMSADTVIVDECIQQPESSLRATLERVREMVDRATAGVQWFGSVPEPEPKLDEFPALLSSGFMLPADFRGRFFENAATKDQEDKS